MTQPFLFDRINAEPVREDRYAVHRADVDAESARTDTARARILARLKQGPATNIELNAIAFRYGARLHELKQQGIAWEKTLVEKGVYRYRLTEAA